MNISEAPAHMYVEACATHTHKLDINILPIDRETFKRLRESATWPDTTPS